MSALLIQPARLIWRGAPRNPEFHFHLHKKARFENVPFSFSCHVTAGDNASNRDYAPSGLGLLGYPFRRALPYAIDLRLSALIYVHCRAESP
jgi:hypothetical protein